MQIICNYAQVAPQRSGNTLLLRKSYFCKCSPTLCAYPVPRSSILSCFLSTISSHELQAYFSTCPTSPALENDSSTGHLQKFGLGLSQLLSPSHATGVSSGNADSVKTRWLSCSPCQHHGNLQRPGGVLAGIPVEGQEALVRAGRGSGPAYHNIPCRRFHCVQGSTLKN